MSENTSPNKTEQTSITVISESEVSKNLNDKNRRSGKNSIKPIIWITVIIFLVYQLYNCSANRYYVTWEEEVQLDDKNIIWVKRSTKGVAYKGFGAPGSVENKEDTLSLIFPFKGSKFPMLTMKYDPFFIDYDEKNHLWTVIVYTDCMDLDSQGKKTPPYKAYQSVNGSIWKLVAVESRLIGKYKNLMLRINVAGNQPKYVYLPYSKIRDAPSMVNDKLTTKIISKDDISPDHYRTFSECHQY